MRQPTKQRYRSVDYQPGIQADKQARYTTRHPVQRLGKSGVVGAKPTKQYSQPLEQTPDYVLLYDDEDEDRPRWEGPLLKKRAHRAQNLSGRIPVVQPVELVQTNRPARGWGWVLVGACFFLSVYLFLTFVFMPWLDSTLNHWQYGASPVYHLQAYVGIGDTPNDPSDFYAEISHNQIVVTQVTSSKVTTYPLVWQGSEIDGYIPTLTTSKDTSTGCIDVLVKVGSMLVTMYNNGSGFQGTKP